MKTKKLFQSYWRRSEIAFTMVSYALRTFVACGPRYPCSISKVTPFSFHFNI